MLCMTIPSNLVRLLGSKVSFKALSDIIHRIGVSPWYWYIYVLVHTETTLICV